MINLLAFALKIAFLILVYLFLLTIVIAVFRDLRGRPVQQAGPARSAQLVVIGGNTALTGKRFRLGTEAKVGRSADNNVVLDDTFVSAEHARIFLADGTYFIEDLGSTNGTFLGSRRLQEPQPLTSGTKLRLGKTIIQFVEQP